MSLKVELPLESKRNQFSAIGPRKRRRPSTLLNDIMLSESSTTSSITKPTSLTARKEGLRLNFHRSISEPQGQKAADGGGLCPPVDIVTSPPSCSPSLHPSKRCKMMAKDCISNARVKRKPPCLPPISTGSDSLFVPPVLPQPAQELTGCGSGPKNSGLLLLHPPPGSVSLPNSPCSESSTLQRTILMKNVRTLDASGLAAKLAQQPPQSSVLSSTKKNHYLLVDCRPFIAYNVSHIKGAINVNCCNRLNRKRLQMGKASLADLATTKDGKELLKKRTWKEVVVYDDCSENLDKLPASHTLFLVMNALVEDNREPSMLLGGLRGFQASNKSLCEDHLTIHPNPDEDISSLLPDLPSPTDICDTKDIENHPATQVLPHMYLGNMRDASDASVLHGLGVSYVLNVTAKPPSYTMDPGIQYKQLVASDNGLQNLRQFFDEAFAFIDEAKNNRSGVLIHCQAGISRSPTIAVAYLMKRYPMAMAEAYKFVKTRRSIISPNLNFMGQLWEFEQGLKKDRNQEEPASMDTQDSPKPTRKSTLASAIEDACNNQHAASDSWSDKVTASSTSSRTETGSLWALELRYQEPSISHTHHSVPPTPLYYKKWMFLKSFDVFRDGPSWKSDPIHKKNTNLKVIYIYIYVRMNKNRPFCFEWMKVQLACVTLCGCRYRLSCRQLTRPTTVNHRAPPMACRAF